MIKLIILDVDGVMTSGKKTYDKDGNILSKEFCDKDWTAIKRFKAIGITVIFLSGDKFNEGIAKSRNIPFWHNIEPKEKYLDLILKTFEISVEQIVYVGDDLFDINISQLVKYRFCPQDAVYELKECCSVLPAKGGDNVIASLFQTLHEMLLIPNWHSTDMQLVYQLDAKEIKHV